MYARRAIINNFGKERGQTAVSVIVPARNEAENLPKLLNSISKEHTVK